MYDSFFSFDAQVPLSCAAGHSHLREEFQTKDFAEPSGDRCYVYEGRLFRGHREDEPHEDKVHPDGDALLRTVTRRAAFFPFTGIINVYTSCGECLPVLYEGTQLWGDKVGERRPWIEYSLTFRDGKLERVEVGKLETRDDVRKDLREALGERVLPDDDRLARRHFGLLARKASAAAPGRI
jgi:hypothetical protein